MIWSKRFGTFVVFISLGNSDFIMVTPLIYGVYEVFLNKFIKQLNDAHLR